MVQFNLEEIEILPVNLTSGGTAVGRLEEIREKIRIHGVLESEDAGYLIGLVDVLQEENDELHEELQFAMYGEGIDE